jgi:hypothetical protein
MAKTVGELKDGVGGILSGLNLTRNVTNLPGAIKRAVRIMLSKIYIPEAVGYMDVNLYSGVYEYPSPETLFGGSLIDLRPQGISRSESDVVARQGIQVFDQTKATLENGYRVAFEHRKGTNIMRVDQDVATSRVELDTMQDDDWTLSGSASGLAIDQTVFYESPASLRFLATGASSAVMTKAIDEQDLSDYEDVGVVFVAIRTPSATNLTSVTLKIGSSASAYNNVSVTEGFLGAWKADQWTLLAFDFSTASQTGTPDWSAIDYAELTFAHGATLTNLRVGAMFIALPSPHELIYKSTAIFSVDGELTNETTDDTDEIVLDDSAYNILEHQVAQCVAIQKAKGGRSSSAVQTLNDTLSNPAEGLYPLYKGSNPDEKVPIVGSWVRVKPFKRK